MYRGGMSWGGGCGEGCCPGGGGYEREREKGRKRQGQGKREAGLGKTKVVWFNQAVLRTHLPVKSIVGQF